MRSYEVELELNKNKNQISKYHSGANLNEFYITDERKTKVHRYSQRLGAETEISEH